MSAPKRVASAMAALSSSSGPRAAAGGVDKIAREDLGGGKDLKLRGVRPVRHHEFGYVGARAGRSGAETIACQ